MTISNTSFIRTLVSFSLILGLTACGKKETSFSNTSQAGPPPTAVKIHTVTTKPLTQVINLTGTLAANERVEIHSEISGPIQQIAFQEGQSVKIGDLLFVIKRDDLQAELDRAKTNLEIAQREFTRAQSLIKSKTISRQQFDTAEQNLRVAQAELTIRDEAVNDIHIHSPINGRIGARILSIGQYITPSDILTSVVDANPLKVDFEVPERYIAQLQIEQTIDIQFVSYPKQSFQGQVYFIAPELNARTRTLQVRALIENPQNQLKPGMFGNIRLSLNTLENAIIIPEEALMNSNGMTLVAIRNAKGLAEFRPVITGIHLDASVQIKEGLQPGEQIVTEGHQKFGPGMPLTPINSTDTALDGA